MHRRKNVLLRDMCVVSCVGVGVGMVVGVGVGVGAGVWVWVVVVGVGVDGCGCGRVTFLHTDMNIMSSLYGRMKHCQHVCVCMCVFGCCMSLFYDAL